MGTKTYSTEALALYHSDLFRLLMDHGPMGISEIRSRLRWSGAKCKAILRLYPEWLVVIGFRPPPPGMGGNGSPLYHTHGEHVLGDCEECGKRNFNPIFVGKPCGRCYVRKPRTKDIRRKDLYPGEVNPLEPTKGRPGSPEKIAVLCERYDRGLPLWHEEDATYECESVVIEETPEWEDWDD
jgi:hypothetical protein